MALLPAGAWATCTGNLISGCPAAVNPQPTDLLLGWQNSQNPHTRAFSLSQVQGSAANPTATAGPTAVNGSALTFMRSDAAPAIQLGTSSQKGLVQVDGTTITATAGVISAVGAVASSITPGTTTIIGSSAPCLIENSTATTMACAGVGTGVISALDNAVNGSGGLLTYSLLGTSGATIPLLNGNNTFSGNLTFSGLASGTQTSCLGLTSGNAVVAASGACGSGGGASITPGTTTIIGATAPCAIVNSTSTIMACDALGTGVVTALGNNVGSAGAFVTFNGAGGTPSSVTLTNGTALPIAGITGLGTGVAAAMANTVNASSGLLTFSIIGTSGATVPENNGNNVFSGTIAHTATSLPTQAAGTLGVAGEVSAPTLAANGEGDLYLTSTTGGITLIGKGSTNDFTLLNDGGTSVCTVATGTTNFNCTGLEVGGTAVSTATGANPTGTAGPTAVNGSATTFMRSDGAPAVQKASASQFGIVETDGSTITPTAGVISCTTATTGQLGCVKPDGTTITIASGVITASGGSATSITVGTTTIGSGSPPCVIENSTGTTMACLGVGTSGGDVGLLNGANTYSGASIFSSSVAHTGTTLPTQAAGTLGISGEASAPTLAANGEGDLYLTSTTGGITLIGKGSTSDFTLLNDGGTSVCTVATGTTNFNCTGLEVGGTAVSTATGANPTGTAGPTAVNGSATTFMRSDGAPAVQKASAAQFGIVETDGSTITNASGVVSCTTATTGQLGCVKPDGTTITIASGVITASGGSATSITPGTTTIVGATAPCAIVNSTSTTMACDAPGAGISIASGTINTTYPVETAQTTGYTIASTDMGKLIPFNISGGGTITIPSSGFGSTILGAGMTVCVQNIGASTDTITNSSSGTMYPAYTSLLAGESLCLQGDGTNMYATLNPEFPLSAARGGTGITSLGTGVATALGDNVGSAGAFVVFNGAGGTPSSLTLTSATGLPISTGVSGLGTGVATALADNTNATGGFGTVGTSGTNVGLLNAALTFSGADIFSSSVAHTGTSLPTQAAGTLGVAGEASAPTLAANGEADLYITSTTGGVTLIGKGSTNDFTLLNDGGTSVCTVATGTTNLNCTGLEVGGTAVSTATGANPTGTAGPTAVNGSATTFMRSDGAPAVQKASASQFGIVETDGSTITPTAGVIACTTATTSQLGCVKPDGTTITIASGVITASGGSATTITVGTTTITSGTSNGLLYDNAGVLGNLGAMGTGVSTGLVNNVNGTNGFLTFSKIGATGATIPLNNGGFNQTGNATFQSTTLASPAAGSLLVGGENSTPTFGAAGEGAVYLASTTGGLALMGEGSTNDLTFLNSAGSNVCVVATGTTTLNCGGLQVNGVSVNVAFTAAMNAVTASTLYGGL